MYATKSPPAKVSQGALMVALGRDSAEGLAAGVGVDDVAEQSHFSPLNFIS